MRTLIRSSLSFVSASILLGQGVLGLLFPDTQLLTVCFETPRRRARTSVVMLWDSRNVRKASGENSFGCISAHFFRFSLFCFRTICSELRLENLSSFLMVRFVSLLLPDSQLHTELKATPSNSANFACERPCFLRRDRMESGEKVSCIVRGAVLRFILERNITQICKKVKSSKWLICCLEPEFVAILAKRDKSRCPWACKTPTFCVGNQAFAGFTRGLVILKRDRTCSRPLSCPAYHRNNGRWHRQPRSARSMPTHG